MGAGTWRLMEGRGKGRRTLPSRLSLAHWQATTTDPVTVLTFNLTPKPLWKTVSASTYRVRLASGHVCGGLSEQNWDSLPSVSHSVLGVWGPGCRAYTGIHFSLPLTVNVTKLLHVPASTPPTVRPVANCHKVLGTDAGHGCPPPHSCF